MKGDFEGAGEAFTFSGFGSARGEYCVTSRDLAEAVKGGYVDGFDRERILGSQEYLDFIKSNPGRDPLEFFLEDSMGFETRYWVSPFPPHPDPRHKTAVDLAVTAIDLALKDAGVHPEQIGLWIVSTVSGPEQAPGIAGTVKRYFVRDDNTTPVRTLTVGCPGFVEGLRTALDAFSWDRRINHVVVAHVEIMSSFLHRTKDIVPLATFGDACGATVVTRSRGARSDEEPSRRRSGGITLALDHQDPLMIGHLGVRDQHLYMNSAIVKDRAIANMIRVSRELLEKTSLRPEEIDVLVPHQTGNKITVAVAKDLGIPSSKLELEVQRSYGNVSGACIPLALSLLKKAGRLKAGTRVLSPTVGVGGEYGAMIYRVPSVDESSLAGPSMGAEEDLAGKRVLLTGATSSIGLLVAKELHRRGAELILHYNSNSDGIAKLKSEMAYRNTPIHTIRADFRDREDVLALISKIVTQSWKLDYIVHTAAIPGSVAKASAVTHDERETLMRVNYLHPIEITIQLMGNLKPGGKVIYLGSIAEDYQFEGSAAYVASKRALHGGAASLSTELHRKIGVSSLYYMLGLTSSGMVRTLKDRQVAAVLGLMRRKSLLDPGEVARRIVESLYRGSVAETVDYPDENRLQVRRDGYRLAVA
jgi:3-oxoacyl-[acyl-carrier-protein] synthase-3